MRGQMGQSRTQAAGVSKYESLWVYQQQNLRGCTVLCQLLIQQLLRLLGSSAEQDTRNHGYSCHFADTDSPAFLCSLLCLGVSAMPVSGGLKPNRSFVQCPEGLGLMTFSPFPSKRNSLRLAGVL